MMAREADGRRVVLAAVLAGCVSFASGALAHVEFQATLDTAQEVPPPVGTSPNAGGTAAFALDGATKILTYEVTLHDLTGPPLAAHVHRGEPGVAGPIVVPLDAAAINGEARQTAPLSDELIADLVAGLLYVNYHTQANMPGEVRGQIALIAGACSCADFKNHGQFVKCVRKAIKSLDRSERKSEAIKALKKASARSSCGKKKGPKKAVACCLPRILEENIVTEALCLAVPDKKCGRQGGTSKGAGSSCFPNPCSSSGAFLEEPLL